MGLNYKTDSIGTINHAHVRSHPAARTRLCSDVVNLLQEVEMAGRQNLQGDPELQQFVLPEARPTGKKLGVGSYGSVEELTVSGLMCAGKRLREELLDQGNIGTSNIARKFCEECQVIGWLEAYPHVSVLKFVLCPELWSTPLSQLFLYCAWFL